MRRLGVVLGFLAVTAVYTYPLSVDPARRALDLGPDTRLFLWTLAWDVEALSTQPLSLFDANIFYPERRTLAYSEHQIGSALLAAPVLLASGNLLLSMNVVLLLSCLGAALAAFYLARTLGLGLAASIVTGIVFALTPPRFFRLGQLHLATVYWIPVCLALLHRYAQGGTRRHLLLAVAAFALQAMFGGQSGLFLALAAGGLLGYLALKGQLRPEGSLARDGALAATLALVLNLPFALPYGMVQNELGLERSLDEAVRWSPNGESFLASPAHVDRSLLRLLGWERRVLREAKAFLFPGLVPLALALLAVGRRSKPETPRSVIWLDRLILMTGVTAFAIEAAGGVQFEWLGLRASASGGGRLFIVFASLSMYRFVRYPKHEFTYATVEFYFLLALVSLWASLGPRGGLYSLLYRVVPGFDFIRVPSRLTLLTVLAVAVLAGLGYERLRSRSRKLAPAAMALLLVELAAFPLDAEPYTFVTPPMDRWLAETDEPGAVAVFPIPDPRDEIASARRHSAYMLNATVHFRPLVNGYSGFTPPRHDTLFRTLGSFPDARGIDALDALGVRFIVFHRDGYDAAGWARMTDRLEHMSDTLRLRASFDEGSVYELVSTRDRPNRGS